MPSTNDESTRRLGIHKRRMKTLFECEKKEQSSYLGNSAQQTLGIQCLDLDLSTGLALDNSTAYISPRPLEQIDTMLNSTKPWQVRNFGDKEYTNYTAALQLWGILAVWLDNNYDEQKEGILQYTSWKLRGPDWTNSESLTQLPPNTACASFACNYVLDTNDPNFPHISCLIGDEAPLKDDYLSFAEIFAIIALSDSRRRDYNYRAHRIIPVTVFSGSEWKGRVVHGYLDYQSEKIVVKKSRIVSFENEKDRLLNMKLMLSWAAGNPMGNTR